MLRGEKVGLRARIESDVAMWATAIRAGFAEEGIRRGSAWVDGAFVDGVLLSLLSGDVRWQ
ncbi:hypothetical protein M1L60_41375 [Actinoplanes sp. TRM 88003]|uniref:Uncharacterized protein n=1 Tax=Paractinoplanes aksuensis TaxID=2939490 RepID=A0ABT1E217_9ACTN|nr:hypothetical protein [Actinoplanes aksuensis]MCO8277050.1 hypothetical protein [Actinoplanes aksuensis]